MNMEVRAIGIDPGNATGIAYYEGGDFHTEVIHESFTEIEQVILRFKPDFIVVEEFKLYPSKARHLAWNEMYPAQVVGAIKLIAEKENIPVIMQPATIKEYVPQYVPKGKTDHEQDATRHIWYYLKKKRLI